MNTSFTPGPWSIDESKAYNNLVVSSTVTGDAICEVLCEPESDLIGTANARLIAAAPTLYAALHNLIARGLIDTDGDHYDEAIKALSLATGQKP
jgi:hypothetical protein